MKRQFALLFALTFMVSGMAVVAEETAENGDVKTEAAQTEFAEAAEWTMPFEDGEWLSVPDLNAEVYLPSGWTVTDVTETGFSAADAEGISAMNVSLEAFDGETVESDDVEISAFESYLMSLGQEYEIALMGETEAAIFAGEESVEVKFLMKDQLVTMTFTPADETGIAGSAMAVAETFYFYTPEEEAQPAESEAAETAEDAAAAESAEAAEEAV